MIWKLLRTNISAVQLLGYALACTLGLAIVLAGIKFYADVRGALRNDGDNALISNEYMVLSRPVSMLSTIGIKGPRGFSQADISDLERQPWVESVGEFTSANFSVAASVDFNGRGMSTHLFLESLPDRFVDIDNAKWQFTPGQSAPVPVIISKDYLALYNFGFAPSRGLPQLTEGLIEQVPLTLYLSGNGHRESLTAKIVGFSSRLNTIAVPYDFLAWANERYGSADKEPTQRLIVEVNNPGDPAIARYIKSRGYDVAGERQDAGRATFFLRLLTAIVVGVGITICILALVIMTLSITLLLQKNRDMIFTLKLMGYTVMQVSKGYFALVGAINVGILVLALVLAFVASSLWGSMLSQIGIAAASGWGIVVYGMLIMLIVTVVNMTIIARRISRV